jgi:hypothetical protein
MTTIQFADEPNQEERIAKLRQELEKLGGSAMTLESMPADMEEEFLRQVLEYETTEPISLFCLLENSGLSIPAPNAVDNDALSIKLNEIVERMASMGAYLLHTNHLSDRELYDYLYRDGLREEAVLFPAIRSIEAGGTARVPISAPVAVMEDEHDHAGALLAELRTLTDGYAAPEWACGTFRALYNGLAELDAAMHVHVHLENNILVPRALGLAVPV